MRILVKTFFFLLPFSLISGELSLLSQEKNLNNFNTQSQENHQLKNQQKDEGIDEKIKSLTEWNPQKILDKNIITTNKSNPINKFDDNVYVGVVDKFVRKIY